MSFTIEAGRHYAIVGENGAGKTTIAKLITRLYEDYDGEILLNGRDLRCYSAAEIKSLSSVVYQDFARYSLSFWENIAFGDINSLELRFNNVSSVAELLGFEDVAERLPNKYDTPLGKIYKDGVDLSGGEWQRLAMARAVISPAPLKILDEPTAALDPISESNLYREFEKISGGGTTIFISHRLGSTKLADTILVVGGGRIIESGTHEELMQLKGAYNGMYTAQSEWYTDNSVAAVIGGESPHEES